jgi:alpha-tubulin suppressor-like RCC1 family protein
MPNPNTNFKDSFGTDLGNKLITKEYLMSVYPQIANQLITPELWTWGINTYGQLGNNNTSLPICTPVTTFLGGANWKQVSGGTNHTAAIKTDGTLWCWGNGDEGQLGDGTGIIKSTPVTTFLGGTNWKQVACGDTHTAAIKTDGTLWTWGKNYSGQIGDDTYENSRYTPVTTFGGGTNWKQVECGGNHTAAIKTDGTLWVWGSNTFGQLGINSTTHPITTPMQIFGAGTNWKQVSCGFTHTAAIKTDGTLWAWGRNTYGQLGNNNTTSPIISPVQEFLGGTNWKQVACGDNHVTAIKMDGTLWSWGFNGTGQVGINNTFSPSTPTQIFGAGTNWKQVACGQAHTSAIKTDGTLWVWGRNDLGNLGINNTTSPILTPVQTFAGGTNWKQVACGDNHTTVIKTSDDLLGI